MTRTEWIAGVLRLAGVLVALVALAAAAAAALALGGDSGFRPAFASALAGVGGLLLLAGVVTFLRSGPAVREGHHLRADARLRVATRAERRDRERLAGGLMAIGVAVAGAGAVVA